MCSCFFSFELLDKNSIAKGGYIGKNKIKCYLLLVCFSEEESAEKANHAGARLDKCVGVELEGYGINENNFSSCRCLASKRNTRQRR